MYSRFIRWATDRLNDNGIIAFITNSSFIDAKTFDGFRKLINEEFSEVYIIDLDGDVRKNPKISGTTHNVFGIQTGVAISFLVKKNKDKQTPCKIFYTCRPDDELAIDKLNFLASHKLDKIDFQNITPDKNNNWINLADDNDFDRLIPVANKETKLAKSQGEETAIFKLFSNGVNTARDEWVFDYDENNLLEKITYFIDKYNLVVNQSGNEKIDNILDDSIKWSADLKKSLLRKSIINFDDKKVIEYHYRPFVKNYYYSEQLLSDRLTSNHYDIFGSHLITNNLVILLSGNGALKPFTIFSTNIIFSFDTLEKTQCLPLYTYDKEGKREENITDWALEKFREYYQPSPPQPPSPTGEGGEDLSAIVGVNRKVSRELLEKAKELRKKQTPTEKILWECLRGNRLLDFKFRRQHNIASFIVDFYCHSAKLVIEIDGKIHEELEQKEKDNNRDEWLKNYGLKVLRIKNEDILNNLENTLNIIIENLLPSPVGEGLGVRANFPVGEGLEVRANFITKKDIFYYIYAVLHNPKYRSKYELNLKREFPKIPFYDDFYKWVNWGKKLMDLHLNYSSIEPYNLKRIDIPSSPHPPSPKGEENQPSPPNPLSHRRGGDKMARVKLKADKVNHKIVIDEVTILTEIPPLAWEYKLGNRSALEWVLDQYKEKKPKDKTIEQRFNNYRFVDYKEEVIQLLMKVTNVSVETMKIIEEMSTIL
jgi:predicted helicase/very-short-patch-repair endonuclease